MEKEKEITITLSDGTQIGGLTLNGNNLISEKELTKEDFEGKLLHVKFTGGSELDGEYDNMELVQLVKYDGKYWFVLQQIDEEKLREIRIEARLDYIEMMGDLA